MNYKDAIYSLVKKLVFSSPYDSIRRMPSKFRIDAGAIILETASFRFDVPGHVPSPSVVIGKDSMVGCNFIFESTGGEIRIGERTYIGAGTNLISRTSISVGNDVWIAWGCYLYDHDSHSLLWADRRKDIFQQLADHKSSKNYVLNKDWSTVKTKPIVINDKAWIGFDSVILKGVTIGEGAIVGARSVVTRDVEPWTVVAGNPARMIKRLDNE
jgi:acetyltransferase-like isoleucine patch superfamily enzyme